MEKEVVVNALIDNFTPMVAKSLSQEFKIL
jgi:hypothetical protein